MLNVSFGARRVGPRGGAAGALTVVGGVAGDAADDESYTSGKPLCAARQYVASDNDCSTAGFSR